MSTPEPEAADLFGEPVLDERTDARLRARLLSGAERDGLLDVAYRTLDTAVGSLLLATTERGLVRVAFDGDPAGGQDHDAALHALAEQVSPRVLRAPHRLDDVSRQLDDYFARRRKTFDVALDLRLAAGFRRKVLDHLPEISYGRTASYAQVAAGAGNPKAVRAAGTACARNPLPIVVPCHRVVRSDGSFGSYAGGAEAKRTLLTLEASGAAPHTDIAGPTPVNRS